METVRYDDFARLELKTARVLAVEPHPNADRLYLIRIEGGGEERQIVAGIRAFYTPEELVGRMIVVVWNIEPAVIRGATSHGMLLAAQDENVVSVIGPDRPVSAGSKVK